MNVYGHHNLLTPASRRKRLAAWLTGGAILLGAGYVASAEAPSGWDRLKDRVSTTLGINDFDVQVVEGTVVSLGDHIVLSDEQRDTLGDKAMFKRGPMGIRTEGGDLYLILTGHFRDVQLERIELTDEQKDARKDLERAAENVREAQAQTAQQQAQAKREYDEALARARANDADMGDRAVKVDEAEADPDALTQEQKLREAIAEARSKMSDDYKTKIDTLGDAKAGHSVAVIGRIYKNGGLQAILVDSMYAGSDTTVQARVD
jgi:hypothetical protein